MIEDIFPGQSEMARRMRALDWSAHPARSGRAVAAVAADLGQHLPRLRVPDRALVGTRARDSLQRRIQRRCSGPPSIPPRSASRARRSGRRSGTSSARCCRRSTSAAEPTRSRDLLLHIDRGYLGRGVLLVLVQPDSRRGRQGRRHLLPGHRDHREGHRRAPPAHAARSRGARARAPRSEEAVYAAAAAILAANPHDVPFALIYRVDEQAPARATDRRRRHRRRHGRRRPSRWRWATPATDPWSLRDVARIGPDRACSTDLPARFDALPTGAWKMPAAQRDGAAGAAARARNIRAPSSSPRSARCARSTTTIARSSGWSPRRLPSALADAQALEDERRRAESARANSIARRPRSSRTSRTSSARR